jgi:hypothetical protein
VHAEDENARARIVGMHAPDEIAPAEPVPLHGEIDDDDIRTVPPIEAIARFDVSRFEHARDARLPACAGTPAARSDDRR